MAPSWSKASRLAPPPKKRPPTRAPTGSFWRRRWAHSEQINPHPVGSSDGDVFVEVNVLDQIQQLRSLFHRALERFPAGDETRSAGALVDHRGHHRFGEIILARCAAGVDETGAAHVAVGHLVTAEVDQMIAGELRIDALVEFA